MKVLTLTKDEWLGVCQIIAKSKSPRMRHLFHYIMFTVEKRGDTERISIPMEEIDAVSLSLFVEAYNL